MDGKQNENEFYEVRRQWIIDNIDEYISQNDKIIKSLADDIAKYPYKSKSRWPLIKVRR
ncbi:hypothetical protein D3C81_1731890 [compost metagenome]